MSDWEGAVGSGWTLARTKDGGQSAGAQSWQLQLAWDKKAWRCAQRLLITVCPLCLMIVSPAVPIQPIQLSRFHHPLLHTAHTELVNFQYMSPRLPAVARNEQRDAGSELRAWARSSAGVTAREQRTCVFPAGRGTRMRLLVPCAILACLVCFPT